MDSKQKLEKLEAFFEEKLEKLYKRPVKIYYKPTSRKNCPINQFDIKEDCLWIEFCSENKTLFFLGMNITLFRTLYDCQLGYDFTLEDSLDFGMEKVSELERKTSLVYLKTFSELEHFFGRNETSSFQVTGVVDNQEMGRNMPSISFDFMEFECSEEGKRYGSLYLAVQELLWRESTEAKIDNTEGDTHPEREIRIRIGEARVLLNDLSHLQVGDTLQTAIPADSLFWIDVDGQPLFRGRPGFFEGKMSIQLEK